MSGGNSDSRGRNHPLETIAYTAAGAATATAVFLGLDYSVDGVIDHAMDCIYAGVPVGVLLSQLYIGMNRVFRRPLRDAPSIARLGARLLPQAIRASSTTTKTDACDEIIRLTEGARDIYHDHYRLTTLADVYWDKGDYENALVASEEALSLCSAEENSADIFSRMSSTLGEMMDNATTRGQEQWRHDIKSALVATSLGQRKKAYERWKSASNARHDDIEMQILYATALGVLDRAEEAHEAWINVAHMARKLENIDHRITKVDMHGTEMYLIKPSEILQSTFALKPSEDPDELMLELRETERSRKIIQAWNKEETCHEFSTVQEILVAKNEIHSLFTRYEKGVTVLDHVRATGDFGVIDLAAIYTATIHMLLTDRTLPTRDLSTYTVKRLDQLSRKALDLRGEDISETVARIVELLHLPVNAMSGSPDVYNKDAHGMNFIYTAIPQSPYARLTAIDFRPKGSVKPEYEMSKLIELGQALPRTRTGDNDKREILMHYLSRARRLGMEMPDLKEFEYRKLNADLLAAVSYYADTFGKPAKKRLRTGYVHGAIHSARRLAWEGRGDRRKYEQWATALEEILSLEK